MRLLRDLWANDDARKYRVALRILEGRHVWMEAGIIAPEERDLPQAHELPGAEERPAAARVAASQAVSGGEREPEQAPALRPVPRARPAAAN
jgi:hypothetical protein